MTRYLFPLVTVVCWLLGTTGCRTGDSDLNFQSDSLEEMPVALTNYREEGPDGAEAERNFHTTSSGLKYRVLRKGNGVRPSEYDRVRVSYRGWLTDGTVFDSSYERGKPTTFKLKDVVAGWTEGLQLVSKGGKIELEIPSQLGYGTKGQPPTIPPGATLHFIVELHDIY